MALAPDSTRLYMALVTNTLGVAGYHLSLVVLDRATLSVVGVVNAPGDHGSELWDNSLIVIPSPGEQLVYVVSSLWAYNAHGYHPTVWRFDTP
jgi:hypothetical protein